MKRYLLSLAFMLMNLMQVLAYDRHGRDYSVDGHDGSSGILAFIIFVAFILYGVFSSDKKE